MFLDIGQDNMDISVFLHLTPLESVLLSIRLDHVHYFDSIYNKFAGKTQKGRRNC